MRRVVLLSLLALTAAAATPALADQQDGKIGFVDRAGKAFALGTAPSTNAGPATYKTTPQTVYMMGAAPTSFAAVKIGTPVQVNYHVEGSDSIADQILIKQ